MKAFVESILVSEEDNQMLTKWPSMEEIYGSIKSMPPDSAPGPDGYPGSFYIACWDIIDVRFGKCSAQLF